MLWFLLSLAGAFFDALYFTLIKHSIQKIDRYVFITGIFLCAAAIMFLISAIVGFPQLNLTFFMAAFSIVGLNFFATLLYLKALQKGDLSLALPMLAFTPAFIIVGAFFLLGESPSGGGIAGILIIVLGSYLLGFSEHKGGLRHPLHELMRSSTIRLMLAVALIWSITSSLDKLSVINSDPFFAAAFVFLLLGLLFTLFTVVTGRAKPKQFKAGFPLFLATAVVLCLIAISINIAFTTQIVSYVISIKRFALVFGVLFGAIIFHEKRFEKRMEAALFMVAGAILIALA